MASDIIKSRVAQSLKKCETTDPSSAIDVFSHHRLLSSHNGPDTMDLVPGEVFAPGAFDSDSRPENEIIEQNHKDSSHTPSHSSQ